MYLRSCTTGLCATLVTFSALAEFDTGAPYFGTVSSKESLVSEPRIIPVVAGGRHRADLIQDGCVGFIQKTSPDVNLKYEAGDEPVFVYARSRADTTLVIHGPDGNWHCNDDTMGFDPLVKLDDATEGTYRIWVGAFTDRAAAATIRIGTSDPR